MMDNKTKTKKLLVGYDPSQPHPGSGNFLVPINDGTSWFFLGLKSRKRYEQGQMVYIGTAITAEHVFAKLVDSGHKIGSVEGTLGALEAYLRMLQDYRIGNILRIEPGAEHDCGFRLVKIADHAPFEQKKMP